MKRLKSIVSIVITLLVLATCIGISIVPSFIENTYVATVTDKERVIKKEDSYYVVFTETTDGEVKVFKNEDSLLRMKFNSSDLQGSLKEGNTYEFKVIGFRIPFFSQYENIIEISEISKPNYDETDSQKALE